MNYDKTESCDDIINMHTAIKRDFPSLDDQNYRCLISDNLGSSRLAHQDKYLYCEYPLLIVVVLLFWTIELFKNKEIH